MYLPLREGFLPFEEARELVRKEGLKSANKWWVWCRDGHRPSNIPSTPSRPTRARGVVGGLVGCGKQP